MHKDKLIESSSWEQKWLIDDSSCSSVVFQDLWFTATPTHSVSTPMSEENVLASGKNNRQSYENINLSL